jgi:hypothetical protein
MLGIQMLILKDLVRLVLFTPAMLFVLALKAFKIRLVYVDTTRLGHFFCDLNLFSQTYGDDKEFVLWVPLNKHSIHNIDDFLPDRCKTISSSSLSKFVGWFRHFPSMVINVTNSHTHVHDVWFFQDILLKNRFRKLTASFSSEVMFSEFKNFSINQTQGDYIAFHWRSGWDGDKAQSFRDTDYAVAEKFCRCLVERGHRVLNIGTKPINLMGVENPRLNEDFDETEILKIILNASIFVGDSAGPTMVAILANKKSLIFDIFPPEIFSLNFASLFHHLKMIPKTGVDDVADLMEYYRYATYGPDLEKLGVTHSKIKPSEVKALLDEFFDLQRLGPNQTQKLLREQFMKRFEVIREIGYPSSRLKPTYLKI